MGYKCGMLYWSSSFKRTDGSLSCFCLFFVLQTIQKNSGTIAYFPFVIGHIRSHFGVCESSWSTGGRIRDSSQSKARYKQLHLVLLVELRISVDASRLYEKHILFPPSKVLDSFCTKGIRNIFFKSIGVYSSSHYYYSQSIYLCE